jgi:hypothetical protein
LLQALSGPRFPSPMFSLRSLRPGLCELCVKQLQFVKLLLDRPAGTPFSLHSLFPDSVSFVLNLFGDHHHFTRTR